MAQDNYQSDFTLKTLFLKIGAFISLLLGKWKFIVLAGLIGGVLGLVYSSRKVPKYNATLTFMLNEEEGGGLGLSSLLGQFGFGFGNAESNLDKILELSKTRRIAQNTLLSDTVEINNNRDVLANHIINNLDSLNQWHKKGLNPFSKNEKLSLKDFSFTSNDVDSFGVLENKALKRVHTFLVGDKNTKPFLKCDYSDITGIMVMGARTTEEELSIELVKGVFNNLSKYYVEKAIEKQSYDYEIIKEKYDSINNRLSSTQYQLAQFEDKNQGLFKKQDRIVEQKLSLEIQKLALMLGEAEKNLQIADFTLKNKTPYIQVIDEPIAPIVPSRKSYLKNLILGGFIGGLMAALFVILRRLYKDIMET